MEEFWADFEEAKHRASRSQEWARCFEVLQIAAERQNMELMAEILKFQGVMIMQELWRLWPKNGQPADRFNL